MISGRTLIPFSCTSAAASKIARACISEISGKVIPSRQPRCPSIGLNSCSSCTRRNLLSGDAEFICQLILLGVIVRQKFVKRRIEKPDRGGQSFQLSENSDE